MSLKHLHRSLILLLLFTSLTLAQTPAPAKTPQTDEQRKAEQTLKAKALLLLEDVIKDSESFKHAENRIRVRALAANVLWEQDETRARALFKEVMASLVDLLNNPEPGEQPEGGRIFEGPQQLRAELLQILAQRDARLAREFLRASRPQGAQPRTAREALPDQPLEMNLAVQFASTDPKQALEIGEEALSRGLSYELPQLIVALREKDPEAAAKLAGETVAKIRSEKLESSHVARQVAYALLREAAKAPEGDGKSTKSSQPLLDQATLRELSEMIAAEALRSSPINDELLGAVQEMMPEIEKYTPERAAQLRRKVEAQKVASGEGGENNEQNNWAKYQSLFEKGSAEELINAAASVPPEMRGTFYQVAASKLMEAGDEARARQLINEHVKEPEQRKYMLAQLDEMVAYKAAEQGKLEQTRKMLAALRTNEERVMLLAQLATGAADKGDKKTALQLLEEARAMMPGRAKNFTQLGALLAVARAYAPLDASRSLAILEPVVDQLNELLAAAIVLGGFMTEEIIKDDEIMMEPLSAVFNEFFVRYLGDLSALARADFERTKALADRFQRDEIRIIARLLIVQSILAPQQVLQRGGQQVPQRSVATVPATTTTTVVGESREP
ncbi:MAG TPA: hypothetical protein VJT09_19370 [Pyrinomonadaceae bacterium]|nr:hypothetical protein [Pyrinomonadaceae bacterium]